MPMYNWMKVNEGKGEYVRKTDFSTPFNQDDEEAWIELYQQYIDAFGHSDKYEKILRLRHKIAVLQYEYIAEDKKFNKTLIKVEEAKIKDIELSMQGGLTVAQAKIHLSKYLGYPLDLTKTSVHEYHTILNEYGKQNK